MGSAIGGSVRVYILRFPIMVLFESECYKKIRVGGSGS